MPRHNFLFATIDLGCSRSEKILILDDQIINKYVHIYTYIYTYKKTKKKNKKRENKFPLLTFFPQLGAPCCTWTHAWLLEPREPPLAQSLFAQRAPISSPRFPLHNCLSPVHPNAKETGPHSTMARPRCSVFKPPAVQLHSSPGVALAAKLRVAMPGEGYARDSPSSSSSQGEKYRAWPSLLFSLPRPSCGNGDPSSFALPRRSRLSRPRSLCCVVVRLPSQPLPTTPFAAMADRTASLGTTAQPACCQAQRPGQSPCAPNRHRKPRSPASPPSRARPPDPQLAPARKPAHRAPLLLPRDQAANRHAHCCVA